MEKYSPSVKESLNCSPSWRDGMDLSGTVVKPQRWEVWEQVVLLTRQHKERDATPPKITLDDIQICVVSYENSSDSIKEKEANTEGKAGIDCVITIEEEMEVQGKSSSESRIELRNDIQICTLPEVQDEVPLIVIDGGQTRDSTKPVKDRGISKVEKATQTEVTQMEMAKICDYTQKAEGSKDTLRDNHQANVVSQNKPRDSEEGVVHITGPDGAGKPEEAACNNLTAGDKGDEEEEAIDFLRKRGLALETARQSFRWYCYPEGEGPRKAYGELLDLCQLWLKPEKRSKQQIVQLLVMEQFLAVLPKGIQNWIWHQHPESCGEAVELMESFLRGLSLLERHGEKALVTFEEVSIYFSEEEWKLLDESQRKNFKKVMMENYENVRALGFPAKNADLIFKVGTNENRVSPEGVSPEGVSPEGVSPGVSPKSVSPKGVSPKGSPDVTGELVFSNGKKKLATRTQKDVEAALPSGPTSPARLQSCGATVKGPSPRKETAQATSCFICSDCGKAFFNKSNIARHQWYHAKKESSQCFSYPKSFAKPSQLAQHQHHQLGEYPCSKCGKSFTDRDGLVRHQAIHTAKPPFHHHAHPRGFYFNYNLRKYEYLDQQIPVATPLFSCPHCGRQFSRRCNLIQHSRIHQYQWQPQGSRSWTSALQTNSNEVMEVQVGHCT